MPGLIESVLPFAARASASASRSSHHSSSHRKRAQSFSAPKDYVPDEMVPEMPVTPMHKRPSSSHGMSSDYSRRRVTLLTYLRCPTFVLRAFHHSRPLLGARSSAAFTVAAASQNSPHFGVCPRSPCAALRRRVPAVSQEHYQRIHDGPHLGPHAEPRRDAPASGHTDAFPRPRLHARFVHLILLFRSNRPCTGRMDRYSSNEFHASWWTRDYVLRRSSIRLRIIACPCFSSGMGGLRPLQSKQTDSCHRCLCSSMPDN